jgi:hypothetical protein
MYRRPNRIHHSHHSSHQQRRSKPKHNPSLNNRWPYSPFTLIIVQSYPTAVTISTQTRDILSATELLPGRYIPLVTATVSQTFRKRRFVTATALQPSHYSNLVTTTSLVRPSYNHLVTPFSLQTARDKHRLTSFDTTTSLQPPR